MSKKGRTSRSKGEDTNPDYALAGIGNYMFQKTLGEGNFAKVKLAKHKLTGQEVAIKIIDKTQLDEKKLGKLYREVRIMKMLRHPNIVRLYEVIETKYTVFLVMEYSSGGELYDYLVVHGRMKEKEARAKFRQILSAMSYCHKQRVIHRDLKAENLLLDSNLDIKIADFGFSNLFDPDGKLETFCGSPPYAAPELFQGRRYTGPEVDIWSLGVILYVLTTGCLPFDGKNLQEMRESVCRGKYRIPFYLSESCEKLLKKFLIKDPTKRASLEIINDDQWINEGYDRSALVDDLSMKVDEDENVIKIMETKFHIDRETVLKGLRENNYDDVTSIYYLLYHEKDLKGEHGEIKKLDVPQRSSMSQPDPASNMDRIDEDKVLETKEVQEGEGEKRAGAPVRTLAVSARRRRNTVSGDAEVHIKPPAPVAEKKKEEEKKEERKEEIQHMPQIRSNNYTQENTQGLKVVSEQTKNKSAEEAIPDSGPREYNGEEEQEDRPTTSSGRKRHNTIVGILRGHIRKPNEVAAQATPTEEENQPRSLRFTFNSNTTSSKPPDDIITEVLNGCAMLNIKGKITSRYILECSYAMDTVKFEVEVCKLPRLKNLHGLKFKRVSGTTSDYKDVCELLLSKITL